jgi:hypothetical protein
MRSCCTFEYAAVGLVFMTVATWVEPSSVDQFIESHCYAWKLNILWCSKLLLYMSVWEFLAASFHLKITAPLLENDAVASRSHFSSNGRFWCRVDDENWNVDFDNVVWELFVVKCGLSGYICAIKSYLINNNARALRCERVCTNGCSADIGSLQISDICLCR